MRELLILVGHLISTRVRLAQHGDEKRGLDPNLWFNNVEIITAEKIGMATTTYVRNIFKYYAAYRLVQEAQSATAALKQQVAPPKQ